MQTTALAHVDYLVQFCSSNGIEDVVISPGSRNAPLILAFESLKSIRTHLIHDERAAAFFALGLIDATGKPVAITCTSGSALLNYAPAVVEAYYRQLPLLVISADRPANLIDHGDGQTIRQNDIYHNYIKSSYTYPEASPRMLDESKLMCEEVFADLKKEPKGPVHLNVPLDEPLYEVANRIDFEITTVTADPDAQIEIEDLDEMCMEWQLSSKKMILVGQHVPDKQLQEMVKLVANDPTVAILVENTSNIQEFTRFCHCIDRTLACIREEEMEDFAPELIISIGGAVISKRIKAYFRKFKAKHTWRVGEFLIEEDMFKSLTRTVKLDPIVLFSELLKTPTSLSSNYGGKWKQKDFLAKDKHEQFLEKVAFSDLAVVDYLLDIVPERSIIHMGNSSIVRYCQLFDPVPEMTYWSNRGVSGIDGSSSTAAGFSVATKNELNVLFSGDISFFYDSNAFWNSELTGNLKIVVISNGGGGIFQILPGPANSDAAKTFFAPVNAKVEGICVAFDLNYYRANELEELKELAVDFFSKDENKRPSVLEVVTKSERNAQMLADYFAFLKGG